jgi:GNAT superfamily N-acetyltransferase
MAGAAGGARRVSAHNPRMSTARKAAWVLRQQGLRGLWWRGLAAIAYRRVTILLKDAPLSPATPSPRLRISRVGEADIDQYRRLRPDSPEEEVRRRLRDGQICLLARVDDEPVASRWYSLARAEIPYLGFAFELPAGVAYVHDAYTAVPARGRGLNEPLRRHGEALLRNLGAARFLAAVVPENTAGIELTRSAGFKPIGRLAAIRLPARRLLLRSRLLRGSVAGHLGTARRIPVPWSIPAPD